MAADVGVVRERAGLERALVLARDLLATATTARLKAMATTAMLVAAGALQRQESRGAHYRSDFPHAAPQAQRTYLQFADARALADRIAAPKGAAA